MRILKDLLYLAGLAASLFYIANPGAGVVELIPDNLPFVGNLDEAAAVGLAIALAKRWRESRSKALPPPEESDEV
jgi:uncharacterized membrane protein YkvA (DUF1232 family)